MSDKKPTVDETMDRLLEKNKELYDALAEGPDAAEGLAEWLVGLASNRRAAPLTVDEVADKIREYGQSEYRRGCLDVNGFDTTQAIEIHADAHATGYRAGLEKALARFKEPMCIEPGDSDAFEAWLRAELEKEGE